jgi:hypothetical protein
MKLFLTLLFLPLSLLEARPFLPADLICSNNPSEHYLVVKFKRYPFQISMVNSTNIGIEVKNSSGNVILPSDFEVYPTFRSRIPYSFEEPEPIISRLGSDYQVIKIRNIQWGKHEYWFRNLIPFLRKYKYEYKFLGPKAVSAKEHHELKIVVNDINSSIFGSNGQTPHLGNKLP